MTPEDSAQFKVTDHYYLKERGGFVIGHLVSGIFRIGMKIRIETDETSLTISGIEYIDNITEKSYKNALTFREKPSLDYVKKVFPMGFILKATDK